MKRQPIGIIGGRGSMGSWFRSYFESQGRQVRVSDLDTALTNREIAEICPVVIISTPIDTAVTIAEEIGPLLTKEQLLMDFCSQKERIVRVMKENSMAQVVGTHPMFGPFTDTIQGQNMILCPGRGEEGLNWAREIFIKGGARVTLLDATEHDRHMALVQGLTHLVTITMARTLQKMDLQPNKVFDISTPIFRINADLMGRLFAQDSDLYATLVGENPYVGEVLDLFMASLKEGCDHLLTGDHQAGVDFLDHVGSFFHGYREKALDRSNKFLNILFDT